MSRARPIHSLHNGGVEGGELQPPTEREEEEQIGVGRGGRQESLESGRGSGVDFNYPFNIILTI